MKRYHPYCKKNCVHKRKALAGHQQFNGFVTRDQVVLFSDPLRTFTESGLLRSCVTYDMVSKIASALRSKGKPIPHYWSGREKNGSGRVVPVARPWVVAAQKALPESSAQLLADKGASA